MLDELLELGFLLVFIVMFFGLVKLFLEFFSEESSSESFFEEEEEEDEEDEEEEESESLDLEEERVYCLVEL